MGWKKNPYCRSDSQDNPISVSLYIFIEFVLDESVILVVLYFPMKDIYQSCDLGCTFERFMTFV